MSRFHGSLCILAVHGLCDSVSCVIIVLRNTVCWQVMACLTVCLRHHCVTWQCMLADDNLCDGVSVWSLCYVTVYVGRWQPVWQCVCVIMSYVTVYVGRSQPVWRCVCVIIVLRDSVCSQVTACVTVCLCDHCVTWQCMLAGHGLCDSVSVWSLCYVTVYVRRSQPVWRCVCVIIELCDSVCWQVAASVTVCVNQRHLPMQLTASTSSPVNVVHSCTPFLLIRPTSAVYVHVRAASVERMWLQS